jgi:hypothetical protein
MNESANEPAKTLDTGVLFWGAALIVGGLVITLVNLDLVDVEGVASFWPLLVVAVGLGRLATAGTTEKRRTGLWITLVGGWLLLNTLRLGGLFWHDSWPLMMLLVAAFNMAWPGEGERRSSQLLLLAVGGWLALTVTFGVLEWRSSWPLLLILIGLSFVTGAVAQALPALRRGRS